MRLAPTPMKAIEIMLGRAGVVLGLHAGEPSPSQPRVTRFHPVWASLVAAIAFFTDRTVVVATVYVLLTERTLPVVAPALPSERALIVAALRFLAERTFLVAASRFLAERTFNDTLPGACVPLSDMPMLAWLAGKVSGQSKRQSFFARHDLSHDAIIPNFENSIKVGC